MKIKEINCGILGIATDLVVTVLPFETSATSCNTHYKITNEQGETIKEGNYWLSEEEFTNWGSDNDFVANCVKSHLGIE